MRCSEMRQPGEIGMFAGAAGATLALFVGLVTTDAGTNVLPCWNAVVRPACAVLLSTITDFSDRTPSAGQPQMAAASIRDIENFTQTILPDEQRSLSPISKVMTPTQSTPFVPMLIIQSQNDRTIPYHNFVDLICALQSKSVDPKLYENHMLWCIDLHSFSMWNSCDNP